MDDSQIKSSLNQFASLPTEIILKVLSGLEDTYHIREFFLYWKETRQLIKEVYFKEIHCLVSPLPQQSHVCLYGKSSSTIFDLKYFGEIDDFLDTNGDVTPRKILFSAGNDFISLFDLFEKHAERIRTIDSLELIMNGSRLKYEVPELRFILGFENLTRLQLGRFDIRGTKSLMKEVLPKLNKLKTIEFLGHNVHNWSEYEWPPNLRSLDCSWNSDCDVLTLNFPQCLKELYLNMANIDSHNVAHLIDRLPRGLEVLMLSYNNIMVLNAYLLNDNIDKLDVSFNRIYNITAAEGTSKFFPENLQELNLSSNFIENATLAPLIHTSWPQNLKVLNLSGNKITDLYIIRIPDSVKVLQLDGNDLRFYTEPTNPKLIKKFHFPKSLESLSFFNSRKLLRELTISENQTRQPIENSIEFPMGLKKLSLTNCEIKTLKYFKFPKSLNYLNLTENNIQDMDTYLFDWTELINLNTLDIDIPLDYSKNLPPNLKLPEIIVENRL